MLTLFNDVDVIALDEFTEDITEEKVIIHMPDVKEIHIHAGKLLESDPDILEVNVEDSVNLCEYQDSKNNTWIMTRSCAEVLFKGGKVSRCYIYYMTPKEKVNGKE